MPNAATWLNREGWLDELPKSVPRQRTTVSAQDYEQRDYSAEESRRMVDESMARFLSRRFGGEEVTA